MKWKTEYCQKIKGTCSSFFQKYINCPNITWCLPEKYFFSRIWEGATAPSPMTMNRQTYTHTTILWPSWILSGTTRVSQHQKGKTNLDLLEQEILSGSGISWTIYKSAPWPTHITMPASHHSVFTGRMPFLLPNQQRQSTEGIELEFGVIVKIDVDIKWFAVTTSFWCEKVLVKRSVHTYSCTRTQ